MSDSPQGSHRTVQVVMHYQPNGTAVCRVAVKPARAEWHQRQVVLSRILRDVPEPRTLDDVYALLLELLAEPPLPGHTPGG